MIRKFILFNILFSCFVSFGKAQMALEEVPLRFLKNTVQFSKIGDSLKAEFSAKGLVWPARYMYIRSFKYEKQLEVWVKNEWEETFKLFKVYKVCATSGTFGPKRKEGDKQIPEGFYYINEFKPNSNFHLALGLNYPNTSDQILSDAFKPGGDIYIHGNCVTIGCIPLTDSLIEQVYYLSSVVKEQGQDFIPVHIYPYRFDYPKAKAQFLAKTKAKTDVHQFEQPLQVAYEYFEDTHQLPTVMISKNGNYVVAGNPETPKVARLKIMETEDTKDPYTAWELQDNVDVVPAYKEGTSAWQRWLYNLSQELSKTLAPNTSISIQLEFIVDTNGHTKLVRFLRGSDTGINSIIKKRFEKELFWNPATKDGIPVNSKMVQNINLAAPEDLD